jgi:hypothetical protein
MLFNIKTEKITSILGNKAVGGYWLLALCKGRVLGLTVLSKEVVSFVYLVAEQGGQHKEIVLMIPKLIQNIHFKDKKCDTHKKCPVSY